uniref:ATP-binding cassette sub-family B member 2 n=1 Tax=Toxoplasma gondii TaxID=5811 RepID=B6E3J6_TOXGO|nr:ATP-binding cassette sub-family B member 2 [Toxoplasma gondii]
MNEAADGGPEPGKVRASATGSLGSKVEAATETVAAAAAETAGLVAPMLPASAVAAEALNEDAALTNAASEKETDETRAFAPAAGEAKRKSSFLAPYTYATKVDFVLLVVGALFSIAGGSMMPIFMSLFGDMLNELNTTLDMNYVCTLMVAVAAAAFVTSWVSASCFEFVADRQIARIKLQYFSAILRQDMAYFDMNDAGTLPTRLESDTVTIRNAIGIKLSMMFQFSTVTLGGLVLGFIRSWQLTLVTLSGLPLLVLLGAVLGYCLNKAEQETMPKYKAAGSLSEEALLGIRTVVALRGEERTADAYKKKLYEAEKVGMSWSLRSSLCIGTLMGTIFLLFALGFWYGGTMVADSVEEALGDEDPPEEDSDPSEWPTPKFRGGDAITVFFAVIQACFAVGNIVPNLTAYMKGAAATADMLAVIERQSPIDPLSPEGRKDVLVQADIRFENVVFSYPARKEKKIFNGLNLTLPAGKTIALVGSSGSGKSTIVQMLQRLYDPDEGCIFIGDTPIKDINIQYLRAQQGIVSQEAKLFSISIGENIALGADHPVTQEEIEEAAKKANAHDFISQFPDKYQTDCGLFGGQLSGGQKQRIVIARALVRRPSILIFDEATSALDTVSEKVVQDALDSLIKTTNATTLIVAHRLTTIRNADQIIVLDNRDGTGSQVVQVGTHQSLMSQEDGLYYQLVQSQLAGLAREAEEAHGLPPPPFEKDLTAEAISQQLSARLSLQSKGSRVQSFLRQMSSKKVLLQPTSSLPAAVMSEAESPQVGAFAAFRKRASTFLQLRTLSLLRPWWPFCVGGVLAAILSGATYPVFEVIFSKFVKVYYFPDPEKIRDESSFWSLIFVALAGCQLLVESSKFMAIEASGYKLISLLRGQTFTQTIHQEVGFFDRQENNVGYLTGVLSSDVLLVKTGSAGNALAMTQGLAAVVTGVIIAFFGDARLAAVVLACFVLLLPATAAQSHISAPKSEGANKKAEKVEDRDTAAFVMSEALNGIRIVSAFGLEPHFTERYQSVLLRTLKEEERAAALLGFFWGFSQGAQYALQALIFWYGGQIVSSEGKNPLEIMQTTFALMFAGSSIGQAVLFSSDAGKAEKASERIFCILDRPSKIDSRDTGGKVIDAKDFSGLVRVEKVRFRYPERPNIPVYQELSFEMKPGETVALVGASGCGKSTVVQLLERFYDLENSSGVETGASSDPSGPRTADATREVELPRNGRITLDGIDIREINIQSLRSLIGLVGQEPVLFSMSVADNIRYAKPEATLEEVVHAAKLANADSFISTFPDGYDTQVGKGGSQLSGGQKQRIAIARALLTQPRMLILDEATSALDAESERIVQATLDNVIATKERVTLMIAHRLSTVRDADKIVVLSNEDKRGSQVVEVGTHDELMAIPDGVYRHLVKVAEGGK